MSKNLPVGDIPDNRSETAVRHSTSLAIVLVLAATTGCTGRQLRRESLRQASTLSSMQQQLVLNNIASFVCDPNAIPSQLNLRGGATQIVNSENGSVQYIAGVIGILGLTHTSVDQWNSAPVVDEPTLRLLRIAYRRSIGIEDSIYNDDFANRLAHRLKMQMAGVPDMALENAHMFARGPALPQLLDRAGWNGELQAGFNGNDPAMQLWQKDTTDIISSNSVRLVQRGEILTEDTVTVTPVMENGVPVVWPGETTSRVLVATPYAAEIRRQVLELAAYLDAIEPGWVYWGSRKDVPKCACWVSKCKSCDRECWVWVMPENKQQFEDFTLRVLRLSNMLIDMGSNAGVSGVMYSPPVSR